MLCEPLSNRGTAFTAEGHDELGSHGLLPPAIETIARIFTGSPCSTRHRRPAWPKNVCLEALPDRNEVMYYRLLPDHLRGMPRLLPTVAQAIKNYSYEYRWPRRVYLSIDDVGGIDRALVGVHDEDRCFPEVYGQHRSALGSFSSGLGCQHRGKGGREGKAS